MSTDFCAGRKPAALLPFEIGAREGHWSCRLGVCTICAPAGPTGEQPGPRRQKGHESAMLKNLFSKAPPTAESGLPASQPEPAESGASPSAGCSTPKMPSIIWDTPRPVRIEVAEQRTPVGRAMPLRARFRSPSFRDQLPDRRPPAPQPDRAAGWTSPTCSRTRARSAPEALQRWIVFQPRTNGAIRSARCCRC